MNTQTHPTYYDLYADDDSFLMRAPLAVIAKVLELHQGAVKRVEAECKLPGGMAKIHHSGRAALGGKFCMIQEAVGPRVNY